VNLYDFAIFARRLIIYVAIGSIVLLFLWIALRFSLNLYRTFYPPAGPPPTLGFGKLPPLRLPSLKIEGNPSFVLETATGELPQLSDQAEVVGMSPRPLTLLGEAKARALAKELDFGGQGKLSPDKKSLIFRDPTDKRTLTIEISTQNFKIGRASCRERV